MPETITRKAAKAAGLTRYYTGKPCIHGHVCERMIAGRCVECQRLWGQRRDPATGQKHHRYPEQKRDQSRKQVARKGGYMPPPREKDCPPRPADGRCECCGAHVGRDKLHLDHDHNLIGEFLGLVL